MSRGGTACIVLFLIDVRIRCAFVPADAGFDMRIGGHYIVNIGIIRKTSNSYVFRTYFANTRMCAVFVVYSGREEMITTVLSAFVAEIVTVFVNTNFKHVTRAFFFITNVVIVCVGALLIHKDDSAIVCVT